MRNRRLIVLSSLLSALLLIGLQALPAGAATVRFGAKLDKFTQPTPRERCDQNAGIPTNATCTWVSIEAAHNGGHEKAPKTGTIGKVRLISCTAGDFTLQIARAKPGIQKAKVVRNGPTLHYVADTQSGGCGGLDGDNYIIQSFNVTVHVNLGDYIAVRAKRIGFIYNSGGNGVLLFSPPLVPGGSFQTADDNSSADLLIQLQYK